ncbi:hypothetical protein FFWV33_15160 [Flavobacterium faecale]|uniref:histidine kinase n=1 Tax=Flavobacterium faecale TaxID=1355330 RepID=A0A2S1LG64_9FLAO|nr:sensor histidine kinase [Flavobacterium faecale]AWG22770.1 hypothetical protein FFWV33_15160 [Flavobacterium faecale]
MKKSFLLVIFFLFAFEMSSMEFQNLTTLNGLSQNDVNCIFQDSRGFIWIGTNDGLNRYDGYDFKIFRKKPRQQDGLVSNIIYSITEDRDGNIWVGTNDNGISKYNITKNTFTSFNNTEAHPKVISTNRKNKLISDRNGSVWALSEQSIVIIKKDNSIVKLSKERLGITSNGNSDFSFLSIFEDSKGAIWIGTSNGILKVNPKNYQVTKRYASFGSVGAISERNSNLFFLNNQGLQMFNEKERKITTITAIKNARKFLIDQQNNIWMSKYDTGIYWYEFLNKSRLQTDSFHTNNGSHKIEDFNNYMVSSFLKDASGLVWIGTSGGGVFVYNPKGSFFKHYKSTATKGSISHNTVRAIQEDDYQNLWIGTENGGLNFLSAKNKGNYNSGFSSVLPSHTIVNAISFDKKNSEVWVGSPGGLTVFSSKTGKEISKYKSSLSGIVSVFSIAVDREGFVWVGTYGYGLWRLKLEKNGNFSRTQFLVQENNKGLFSNIIRSLFQDSKGNLWVGTPEGLNKIDAASKNTNNPIFTGFKNSVTDNRSISNNYILPIFESSKGTIWVGTLGGGLNKLCFSKNGTAYFETISTAQGLPNDVIKGILEDEKGALWISSNKGISCYNPMTKAIRNFSVSEGLQDFEFKDLSCFKRKNGEMLFGGVNGFNSFFPSKLKIDTTANKVVFTSLEILNQAVDVGEKLDGNVILENSINTTEKLVLAYQENSFTIHFSGLHFASPLKNQYKYKLEGFDKNWVSATSEARFAKYTNLSPGTYTLKVKASNSDGYWNEQAKTIVIYVKSPWWFSSFAIVCYAFLFLLALWFFRRFTIIGVQRKSKLEMESFEKEKIQKLSQLKLQFFTNISHEFRTPLTLIIGPISKLLKDKEAMSLEKVQENYQIINRNANQLLRLINQLMDFRKLEQGKISVKASEGNLVGFVRKIMHSFQFIADQKEIELQLKSKETNLSVWFDEDKLEKVFLNLLSNAFKFTPRNGKVTIEIVDEKDSVSVIVKDNGIGISQDKLEFIFNPFYQVEKIADEVQGSGIGLSFSKELVEMHHGRISILSKPNKGTKLKVTLLKGRYHFDENEVAVNQDYSEYEVEETPNFEKNPTVVQLKEVEEQKLLSLLIVEDNIELRKFVVNNFAEF